MNMLIHAHSGLRYVVLGLLIASIVVAYSKWKSNDQGDSKIYLFAFIAVHTQLLIGLILFMISPKVDFSQMGVAMFRFFSVEHTIMMLIAIVLVTFGRIKAKKLTGANKHRTVLYFYVLALLIIIVAIPWPFRNLGSGWF